jgi:GntR family transcriptional regulator
MIIKVDTGSPMPPYDQIREQITTTIDSGVLGAGAKLPAIRQLATDLDLAPGTVAGAYRELGTANLIATRGRLGTEIIGPPKLTRHDRETRLYDEAVRFARTAEQLGMSTHDPSGTLRRAFES